MDDNFLPELWNLTPLMYFPFHLFVNYIRSTKCHLVCWFTTGLQLIDINEVLFGL